MDPGTGSRRRHSLGRELLVVARTETAAAGSGRKVGDRSAEDAAARARVDPHVAEGPSGERKGAHQFLRGHAEPGIGEGVAGPRDLYSTGPAAGAGGH